MAEVLQPLPPSSNPPPIMLRTRPVSDSFNNMPPVTQTYQSSSRPAHFHRASYGSHPGSPTGYRSSPTAPIQPYAFKSTPNLRADTRTISAPVIATVDSPQSVSVSPLHGIAKDVQRTSPTSQSSPVRTPTEQTMTGVESSFDRPASLINLSSSVPDLTLTNFDITPKSSPNRYRRSPQRAEFSQDASVSSMTQDTATSDSSLIGTQTSSPTPSPARSETTKSPETASRYRRRSLANLDTSASTVSLQATEGHRISVSSSRSMSPVEAGAATNAPTILPVSSHTRTSSATSTQSMTQSVRSIEGQQEALKHQNSPTTSASASRREASPSRLPASRGLVDVQKRMSSPSPLSQTPYNNVQPGENSNVKQARPFTPGGAASPAAQHLAALTDKDVNKGMKSRLRRAFSFGSAAELRKASSGTENAPPSPHGKNGALASSTYDEEQAEIVRQQEAAGIGAGIYSGQGGFAGSTDNLSISSTASSASLMLREMGSKVKKGGRSMKGLFRPKSVIGVSAADGPVDTSLTGKISLVTVEAERQMVNVNMHASEQMAGEPNIPKLERNSVDLADDTKRHQVSEVERRSDVGEVDGAKVSGGAVVRRGILKRPAVSSPSDSLQLRPQNARWDSRAPGSPGIVSAEAPRDERQSRSLSSNTSSSDYFDPRGTNGAGGGRSMPATPVSQRSISFSPRIQFHDALSIQDYDRRCDIATCNKLTPLLAQQIKEELNALKMEMEVHEMSRSHTHFF